MRKVRKIKVEYYMDDVLAMKRLGNGLGVGGDKEGSRIQRICGWAAQATPTDSSML